MGGVLTRKEARRVRDAVHAALDAGYPLNGRKNATGALAMAAAALGLARSGMAERCARVAALYPDLAIDQSRERTRPLDPIAKMREDVALARARTDAAEARGAAADLRKELARLQDQIAELQWASNASIAPARWTLPSKRIVGREHIPVLLTSDFQIGETIRPSETDNAHGYSTEIFRQRYRKLIDVTIKLCADHAGASWKFPGIIYERGGDTISGAIHEELAQTDDVTPIQAVEIAFQEEAAGIEKLAEAFGRVDVKECGGGNHDRTTRKPQSKLAALNSYDRLVSVLLHNHFRNDPRVTFQFTESPDVRFPVYGRNVLLTHGDKIGSRGGQGFIGPYATILRGAQKVIMEQHALGHPVDEVHVGHFHTEFWTPWCVGNGCLPGYSEYAKMNRMRPSAPAQWLMFYHPEYGSVDHKLIVLEKPVASAANDNARQGLKPRGEFNAAAINVKPPKRGAKRR